MDLLTFGDLRVVSVSSPKFCSAAAFLVDVWQQLPKTYTSSKQQGMRIQFMGLLTLLYIAYNMVYKIF